jgi:hypothetical protein
LLLYCPQIQYASLCILNNPGCLFIATNADARGHFTPHQEWAGAGATVGAIKGARDWRTPQRRSCLATRQRPLWRRTHPRHTQLLQRRLHTPAHARARARLCVPVAVHCSCR